MLQTYAVNFSQLTVRSPDSS